jgi:hypothetical protein
MIGAGASGNVPLCVPKTSSGDDFDFGWRNSLFLRLNSLFG